MQHTLASAIALALAASSAAIAGSIEAGDRLEMAAVLKAPVTPTQAVKIAEAGGGRAYVCGMEAKPGTRYYEVAVLRGDATIMLHIDPTTGKVVRSEPARGEDAQGSRALAGNPLGFGAAIAAAERAGAGPSLEANAAGHGDKAYVDVDVIQDHGKRVAHYRVTMQGGRFQATLTGADT